MLRYGDLEENTFPYWKMSEEKILFLLTNTTLTNISFLKKENLKLALSILQSDEGISFH